MAVAFDASSESGTIASAVSPLSWTHTPVGTPGHVWVGVGCSTESADSITSVTYGGVTMTAVTGAFAQDTGSEVGFAKIYELKTGIPSGAQTVVVTSTGGHSIWATSASSTTAAPAEVDPSSIRLLQGSGTLAEQSIDDSSPGTNSTRYAFLYTGLNSTPSAGANSTIIQDADDGTNGFSAVRETTAGQGARSVGWSSGSTDERAGVFFVVRETSAVEYEITASPATFTLTGVAANLRRIGLSARGEFSFTGVSASLEYSRKLAAAAGSFVLTGVAATPLATRRISNNHGVFQLTGRPATFNYTLYLMPADAGSFSLSGIDAVLLAGKGIVAETGSFLLTGNDGPSNYSIPSDTGSFVLTGNTASIRTGIGAVYDTGVFLLTGIAATPLATRRMIADAGSFAINGRPVAFPPRHRLVLALNGVFNVNGNAVIDLGEIAAETGVFSVNGRAAGMTYTPIGGRAFSPFQSRIFKSRIVC